MFIFGIDYNYLDILIANNLDKSSFDEENKKFLKKTKKRIIIFSINDS